MVGKIELHIQKLIKNMKLVKYLLLLSLFTSCLTVKKIEKNCDKFAKICLEDEVKTSDTVKIYETIIKHRDTIIPFKIKGETKYIEVPVYLERGIVNSKLSILETKLCKTSFSVRNSKLSGILIEKDTTIMIKLENALKTITKLENELIKETSKSAVIIKEDTKFGKFAKKAVILELVLIVLFILTTIYKNKLLSFLKRFK